MIDSIVVFKWVRPGYRSYFNARTVNLSHAMTGRLYSRPHRFICVTDDASGLNPGIEVVPMWSDFAELKNPTWPDGPNCYPRLKLWSDWFANIAGERYACLDLDIVFTRELRSIFDRAGDLLMWRTNNPRIPFCASMMVITAGAHRRIWDDFDPIESPKLTTAAGLKGSDQAWIRYCMGDRVEGWGQSEGIYGYQERPLKDRPDVLPTNARAVIFTGKPDPWERSAQRKSPWIRRLYR